MLKLAFTKNEKKTTTTEWSISWVSYSISVKDELIHKFQ